MAKRAARSETTYEVYLLEGRHWRLHARFRSNEKDSAIAEARDLDRRGEGHGVKVVRETFYPDYNKTEEAVIFVGQSGARQNRMNEAQSGADLFGDAGGGRGAPSGPVSGLFIAWRIIVITVFSLGFGILAALATSMIMGYMAKLGYNTSFSARSLVFAVFLIGVVAVALPMLMSLVITLSRASHAQAPAGSQPSKPKSRSKPKQRSEPDHDHGFDFDFKEEAPHQASYSIEAAEDFEDGEEKSPWWKLSWFGRKERSPDEEELLFPSLDTASDPSQPQVGEEPAFSITPDEEAEEDEPQPLEEEGSAIDFEQHRLNVMRFLGGAISVIKTVRPQLDAYTKFAFDLVLAGACEMVAASGKLDDKDKRTILREAVEMIGTKADQAQLFADKYEDYFVEDRYKKMAELGREAMKRFMANDPQPFVALPSAIESWDKPQMKMGAQQSIMTVFFTDMVGSTDMTQEKGDFAAQEIVRRHNAIVRSALAQHGGREIKHTGDGIMATCPTAPSAVQACIEIQRAIASFNATNPPIPLDVRIGLNAGEPIEEENDLFGATVQLAARVCAQAQARQILCAQSVRDLSPNKADVFMPLGQFNLKGFKDPIPLFEIGWQAPVPASASAPAAASAPAPLAFPDSGLSQ
ncbi:MAG: adenylate/guanylate cyclase domain-containing protein [Rhodospirillales bacterium]|nr:adenylate/guanylate cyclase domain-containing protein [Rhodospirillales bacterium]